MTGRTWTRGLFHHFHQNWTTALANALNAGGLPASYFALVEQNVRGPIPDVLTLKVLPEAEPAGGGVTPRAVATAPPPARLVRRKEGDVYAAKADRITVRHRHGDVVAVAEIVSPGNKGSRAEFRAFVEKAAELIRQGVHLLVVDLFPPAKRNPQALPQAIWDQFEDDDLGCPPEKPLAVASFDAGPPRVIYAEPVAVGDVLPEMPLFLKPGYYVPTPLEKTYQATWEVFPRPLKGLLGPR